MVVKIVEGGFVVYKKVAGFVSVIASAAYPKTLVFFKGAFKD